MHGQIGFDRVAGERGGGGEAWAKTKTLRERSRDSLRRNTLDGDFHRLDETLCIELHPVDAGCPVIRMPLGQRAPVINNIPLLRPRRVQD